MCGRNIGHIFFLRSPSRPESRLGSEVNEASWMRARDKRSTQHERSKIEWRFRTDVDYNGCHLLAQL
jgi:hypothetical protein